MIFANSDFFTFVNFQTIDFLRRVHEQLALMVILRQMQDVAASPARQSSRHYQQIGAQRFQRRVQILRRQTQSLEPMRNIEGQQHQLKEGNVGQPVGGGNFAHRQIVQQFANVFFDGGARTVKNATPAMEPISSW